MFQNLVTLLTLACTLSSTLSAPVYKREVPQEHSHEQFLTTVRTNLNLNNPNQIQDPVFALLGNAAAAAGAGKITDIDCLQQATADQAFTNAKARGDVQGMVAALIYRALERNTGRIGQTSAKCNSLKAVNPEIAAIQQHQDPASTNAKAVNKAITLELAKQIAKVGGNPQDALKSGTFAPGRLDDATAKGNTCDDLNDPVGCIFTQNRLVEDATAAEINAAVAGTGTGTVDNSGECPVVTNIVTVTVNAPGATPTAAAPAGNAPATGNGNLQAFTGKLGNVSAPAVTAGGRGFIVAGSDSFLNKAAAIGRSCDIQHNQCANVANSAAGRASGLTVGQCDAQTNQCRAANGV
ncbi:hypothetical protein JR316_0007055 [Psilocybe cubensis]|uniref:Uncharacterized protein n=2 Tax=Psilocybe cubensis TaxID=181762 RepID=A0A8H7XZ44_PSICU|nr:hypothetical protein JR316_0007055 [Psilocybe cubensis]KAH9480455.1 hypothetical protein JR316_0007055 [Psilocybe cubensis]